MWNAKFGYWFVAGYFIIWTNYEILNFLCNNYEGHPKSKVYFFKYKNPFILYKIDVILKVDVYFST